MPQPASIEADEYSRWDDDDFGPRPAENGVEDRGAALPILHVVAGSEADGGRLDKWLAARLPEYSRSRIQRWIGDGQVTIADRVAVIRDAVWAGDAVRVAPQRSDDENAFLPEDIPLDIVHEDASIVVIDKRAGLVVHPASGNWSGTLLNGLLFRDPALADVPRAGIVHRLDKDTSGLMVVARTVVAQTDLVRQLQARTVGRRYLAIVHGTTPATGRIDWPVGRDPRDRTKMSAFKPLASERDPRPGTKPAATGFRTLATVDAGRQATVSLVLCTLETGRTHQIRVHLQGLGHPLVGDATYGGARAAVPFGRQALHAWRLRLVHPQTGKALSWRADPPADFDGLASSLGFDLPGLLDAHDD